MVDRFDVFLVNLDPVPSNDPKNSRPAVVISPNEMNHHISTVIIAPISSSQHEYPTRVPVEFLNSSRYIVLDQVRTVDRQRLVKKIGEIAEPARSTILARLSEMFAA